MKKLNIFLSAGLAIIALAACNSVKTEIESVSDSLVPMTFSASVDGIDTKTALDSEFRVLWSTDDHITVFAGENASGSQFDVKSVSSEKTVATFNGLSSVSPTYYALFPAQSDATIFAGKIAAEFPTAQTAVEGSFGPTANLGMAMATGDEFQFKNVGAIVGLTVDDASITSIRLEGLGANDYLSGKGTIDYNGGEPAFTVTDGKNYVQMSGTFAAGKTYYFVVLPGTYANGFKVTFTKPGYTMTAKNTTSATIARNGNVLLGSFPVASNWKANFTPGEDIFIKGLSEAENGQKVTYISDGYYNTSLSGAGDMDALKMTSYNYEVFAKIAPGEAFYFETADGARFGLNADGTQVTQIGSDETGAFRTASDSPYRIRLNLPSGEATIARIDRIETSLLYTSGYYSNQFVYSKRGTWQATSVPIKWGVQSWDAHVTRYRFKIWFNRKGNSDIDVWQQYGTVTKHDAAPTSMEPSDSYYYLQPFTEDTWNEVFYFPTSIWDAENNERFKANVVLHMNADYGHFTHCFTDIIDTMADADEGLPMTIAGAGAETGHSFNYVYADMYSNPSDQFSETAGVNYNYEIYAGLTAGQPVWFERNGKMYSVSGDKVAQIESSANAMTVSADGAYRIRLMMPSGKASVLRVKEAKFELSPRNGSNPYDSAVLSYEGKGVFAMRNHSLNWQDVSWEWDHYKDTRYKLWFTFETAEGDKVQAYGHNGDDGMKAETSGAHLNIQPVSSSQWDYAKKIPYTITDNKDHGSCLCDLEVYMNFSKQEGHYTQVWIAR